MNLIGSNKWVTMQNRLDRVPAKHFIEASEPVWQRIHEQIRLPQGMLNSLRHGVAVSSFIGEVAERYPEALAAAWLEPISANEIRAAFLTHIAAVESENELKAAVRRFRHAHMAASALLEWQGQRSLAESLAFYSELADTLIIESLHWLEQRFYQRLGRPLDIDGELQHLYVLGMGKLGGRELNFSSDIDLIFYYPEQGETQGGSRSVENSVFFTRLAQALIAVLDENTFDGQAFRVDMRLRPFGQSGPLVTSLAALEHYYQEQGRDWERYAMVKARLLNRLGKKQTNAFQELIRPFVYRRYIDFGAIEALRKMKLLITQETRRQGAQGNIKLAAGGIREVEFIAQAHQLIRGGREKSLQTRSIYRAYEAMVNLDIFQGSVAKRLLQAYELLREVEHRLQQLADEQTQKLPHDESAQEKLAYLMGEEDFAQLEQRIVQAMDFIHNEFKQVVGEGSECDEEEQSLQVLWQDMLEDDAALEIIAAEGEQDVDGIWRLIKQFRSEARKRSSGPRGRAALARLMPLLFRQMIAQPQSMTILERVLTVIRAIMSRTAYIELLAENPGARVQLCRLCAASPWVSQQLALHPILLDELIDPQHLYQLPDLTDYPSVLNEFLIRTPEDDLESQMDALRQAKQVLQLKIAAADITGGLELMKVSDHLSYLAQAVTAEVVHLAWRQMAQRHGTPPGRSIQDTGFGVLAYGKLGGLELGYGSDLDLVFVTHAQYEGYTDGAKPIEVQQFYLRLAQRILHLFTTRTVAGVLYEVDLRLRPSGQAGLLVTQLDSFIRYLRDDAWTWELQALVRARPIYGTDAVQADLQDIRCAILSRTREATSLREDILAMRQKMRAHLSSGGTHFDIKQDPGGIADIEFIAQYLVLNYAHDYPQLTEYSDNIRILTCAEQCHLIDPVEAQDLINAYQIFRCESHALALQCEDALSQHDLTTERDAVRRVWSRLLSENASGI